VDTHVTRLTNRLGLVATRDPVKIEYQVCSVVPKEEWTGLSLRLILHGRRICDRAPAALRGMRLATTSARRR
jgi:endonuclease-3